jgi:ABC-type Fe3+/spermidine/putrescine transport system ATPase subunit
MNALAAAPVADTGPLLTLSGISKVYAGVTAVHPLDLEIRRGDFFAILGPSGCGKTTLLRMIGGFVEPTTGDVFVEGRRLTGLGPEKRPTNMVFQGYGLFPHMTVRQNIGYGLKLARVPQAELDARIDEATALVRLDKLGDRSVTTLSGGQAQRVALARALVMRPPVLLLDEPLAALDLKLRQAMQEELRRIHQEIGGTFVFVTHDQGEAMSLANRIAVMDQGRMLQVGTPEEIYARPASLFVATFIGEANVLQGRRRDGAVELAVGARFPNAGRDGPVSVVVRPEALALSRPAGTDIVSVSGRIAESLFMGSFVRHVVELPGPASVVVQEATEGRRSAFDAGMPVTVSWSTATQSVLEG